MSIEFASRREGPTSAATGAVSLRSIVVGTPVSCADGRDAGEVKRVLLDATASRVTDLVVRSGMIWGRDRLVAADLVTEASPTGVVLRIGPGEFNQLPEYRTDEEIAAEIERGLWDNDLLRRTALPRLAFEVEQGVVTLRGPVAIDMHRDLAQKIVEKVPGVRTARNQLVADNDLEIEVAGSLGDDPRTQRHFFGVRVEHGIVYLAGDESAGQANAAAFEIAAAVPGVRGVRADTRRAVLAG